MTTLYNCRKPASNKAMGIEIECLIPNSHAITRDYIGFFYAGDDYSIDYPYGSRGVEFVSQPLTAPWLKKEIEKLFRKFPWTHNSSCGIHIHVSRKWMTDTKAQNIYDWYSSLDQTTRIELFGRDSNEYCRPGYTLGRTRYTAVNTTNTHTIEFRMFSSGDSKWAQWCVDMVCWMVDHHAHLNIDAALAFKDLHK